MKSVLTDHHILILQVLKYFHILNSLFIHPLNSTHLSKPRPGVTSLESLQNLPDWRMHPLCSQDALYKGALRTST